MPRAASGNAAANPTESGGIRLGKRARAWGHTVTTHCLEAAVFGRPLLPTNALCYEYAYSWPFRAPLAMPSTDIVLSPPQPRGGRDGAVHWPASAQVPIKKIEYADASVWSRG